jgi:dTDP-4-dehydrorhamnose reductase
MKFLIAGARGQLAAEIIKALTKRSFEFVAPDESDLDITDFSMVSRVMGERRPDVVINCAAYNAVDDAEKEWRKAYMINGVGVRNLANAARTAGSVLVHFGTDYVFDGMKTSPYTIADRPSPATRYGESKLLGEMYVRDLLERFFLIRLSWVFGKGEFSFPTKVLEWASKKRKLRIVDDQVAGPAYAAHLAGAVLDLINTGAFGLYHMTNTGQCSRYEWAKFVLEKTGWKGELVPAKSEEFNTAAKRPPFSVLDNFPLHETIGYALPTWQEATEEFLRIVKREG